MVDGSRASAAERPATCVVVRAATSKKRRQNRHRKQVAGEPADRLHFSLETGDLLGEVRVDGCDRHGLLAVLLHL